MKLPNDRKQRNHEAWIVGLLMIIVACITYWIAVQWVYRGIRATQPAKAVWIYQTPMVEPVKAKEKPGKTETIARVIECLCQIESRGRTDAIGDNGRAVGILQIWPIMVREATRISGIPFTLADRLCPNKSREMAWVVLSYYQKKKRIEDDPVRLAGLWNRPDGRAPARYLSKFEQEWNKEDGK